MLPRRTELTAYERAEWLSGQSEFAVKFLRLNWRIFAALGLALCLLALLVHPAPAQGAVLAAFVLLPVFLFGLLPAPRPLWPPADPERRSAGTVLCRAGLFQRPPPFSLQ